jgi:catecholate siderophore receptor
MVVCVSARVAKLIVMASASAVAIAPYPFALAQTSTGTGTLPEVTVEAKQAKKKAASTTKAPSGSTGTPAQITATPADKAPTPDAKGDVGYLATRTTSATKTDTPLRNVPQSISVVTDEQIKDQAFQSISDVTRYVPGVIIHQGEGNRDQISIRGQVASTADFFLNGVRDDAQIFRDLYNTERIEVLKGPAALIFGRGGAGGVLNRVTKEAEFRPAFGEATVEYGTFDHRRTVMDAGAALSGTAAFRITAMYENSGSYRDFVDLDRWAVNPTMSFKLGDRTKVTMGYEHAVDHRTADRGIPSFNGFPAPTSSSTFFGSPDLNRADATVDRVYATVEHKTDFGLSIRNHTSWAQYDKSYQNIYPGTSLSAASAGANNVGLVAYNNNNNRENLFNQTDFTYKFDAGITRHTLLFGSEFGHQESDNWRHNGDFLGNPGCLSFALANNSLTGQCNVPFANPTLFTGPVDFSVTQTRNHVEADVRSFYIQDQIKITRYLELIAGLRHDTFSVDFTNLGPANPPLLPLGAHLTQTDNMLSPRAGVILKPTDYLSFYGSYSVTYLPASGDQFNGVNTSTLTLDPEKYTNREVGAKWDMTPTLAFTTAYFVTDRENVRFPQANNTFVQSGKSQVQGIEVTLTGYLTDKWQVAGGYQHIFKGELTSQISATLLAGNPLPLLPEDTFSLWNRYQFTPFFGAGVGLVYHSDSFATLMGPGSRVVIPAFTTVDAALFFKFSETLSAQVNVTNIFNEGYIVSADGNDNLTPGAPRTAILSVTSKF